MDPEVIRRHAGKVDRAGGPDACWPWTAGRTPKNYGALGDGHGGSAAAHRVAYTAAHGPIPEGYTVDHTCHNIDPSCPGGNQCEHRSCQNPNHLEAVPGAINTARGTAFSATNARKTHCPAGHELSEENIYGPGTYQWRKGRRACKPCAQRRAREQHRAKQAAPHG